MARATPQRASDAPRDAIALLKQDHRTVEALFDQFEDAEEQEQSQLAERICNMLTVHAQIEEEILYPAAKEAFEDEEEEDLVHEAAVEHATAKDLIAKIEAMTPDDEAFEATVKVLCEYVKHHVKEEENELFPALKKTELDLKEMGGRLAERKFALMEELGIPAEEPPAAERKKARATSRATATKARQARAGSKSARNSGRAARH
jgi:hemerythrin superfamily protein